MTLRNLKNVFSSKSCSQVVKIYYCSFVLDVKISKSYDVLSDFYEDIYLDDYLIDFFTISEKEIFVVLK